MVDGERVNGGLCFQAYCSDKEPGVSEGARSEAARGVRSGHVAPSSQNAMAGESTWEQARYVSATLGASIDGLRADLKDVRQRLQEVERVQRETLKQSTEAAAISRAVKRTPLGRFWKRTDT
jgi:hypothetical protein